jgi:hypothetical protein
MNDQMNLSCFNPADVSEVFEEYFASAAISVESAEYKEKIENGEMDKAELEKGMLS